MPATKDQDTDEKLELATVNTSKHSVGCKCEGCAKNQTGWFLFRSLDGDYDQFLRAVSA